MQFKGSHDSPLRSHLPQTQKTLRRTLWHCFPDPVVGEGERHGVADVASGVRGYLPSVHKGC